VRSHGMAIASVERRQGVLQLWRRLPGEGGRGIVVAIAELGEYPGPWRIGSANRQLLLRLHPDRLPDL